ncbi:MAG: Lon-like protease [Nocardioidaceae bacterium]|jgi:PDZ domain-containing protein|nr:Lon-like protease [Nocardioidaceae bacterium]
MSRRSVAGLLAVGVLLVLVVVASRMPAPYVTVSPGPTVNVLGSEQGKPIVQITGHRTYPTHGQLRLVTVSITNPDAEVSLVQALSGWVRKDVAVLPREAMYPDDSSPAVEQTQGAAQMVNSQDTAAAVALSTLGYHLRSYVEVTGVTPQGASAGRLKTRDEIQSLNGTKVHQPQQLLDAMSKVRPGEVVTVGIRRDGAPRTVRITTRRATDNPQQAVLGIIIGQAWQFPFDVRLGLSDAIVGPSAGLMFALSIYDRLTPGSLTHGLVVSGTGTIASAGQVGPIGGIQQKIVAAQRSGARLFFVPKDNCAEALQAPRSDAMRLVLATTFKSALSSLKTYADDPSAPLPRCTS